MFDGHRFAHLDNAGLARWHFTARTLLWFGFGGFGRHWFHCNLYGVPQLQAGLSIKW
jgi:hypothetical protein